MIIYCYEKCSTCQKAVKFLTENNEQFTYIDYTKQPPTVTELEIILKKAKQPINKLFNTSGLLYRELNMKEKQKSLSTSEILEIMYKNPMLIKRPLLVLKDTVLIGFNGDKWLTELGKLK